MLRRLANPSSTRSLAARFRRKRMRLLDELLSGLDAPIRLLDVGGTAQFWDLMSTSLQVPVEVTLVNLPPAPDPTPRYSIVPGDARHLDFEDQSFDVVFSNSVIEHVGDADDMQRMADEVRRVGRRYFVQTPNRWFPLEPHFLFPFFQFLPLGARAWLVQRRALGWQPRASDRAEADRIAGSADLLTRRQLRRLFPGATIWHERLLGLTKSFVAYDGWGPPQGVTPGQSAKERPVMRS